MTWHTWTAVGMTCDRDDCEHRAFYGGNYDVGEKGVREWKAEMTAQGWRFGPNRWVQCPGCTARLQG